MGYKEALEKAGATVHAFEYFGDYQGSWYAYVSYSGKIGWVQGAFGSCSHCDAFQNEFDMCYSDITDEEYQNKLYLFGEQYLKFIDSTESILEKLNQSKDWDLEADKIILWVENSVKNYKN